MKLSGEGYQGKKRARWDFKTFPALTFVSPSAAKPNWA